MGKFVYRGIYQRLLSRSAKLNLEEPKIGAVGGLGNMVKALGARPNRLAL